MTAVPVWHLVKFLGEPLVRRRIRRSDAIRSAIVLIGAIAAVAFVPLPCRVAAPLSLELAGALPVYVASAGTVSESVAAGSRVVSGTVLARLIEPNTRLERVELAGQRDRQLLQLRHLEARRGADPDAAAQIPAARQTLADLDERLQQLERYEDLLELKAPQAGSVILPPRVSELDRPVDRLHRWSGTPLDPANRGCYLEAGTLFCLVGDPRRLEAVAIVDQSEIDLIATGQDVRIRLDQLPWQTVRGTVVEMSRINVDLAPPTLLAGSDVAARTDRQGISRLASTAYQVRVRLHERDFHAVAGAPGRCKISVAPQSIGRRLVRFLARTFGTSR
jgi:hypothetical protein